jgi:serine/threonine protein kinase
MEDASAEHDPLVGKEILGNYEVVRRVGRGGMAVVYLGRHVLTEQAVAIKALPPDLAAQPQVKARFIEEARTLARLEHPNIVTMHNFAEDGGHLFLVMQFAEGDTLDDVIEREGRLTPADVVSIGGEVLKALGYAHEKGVIHRDIKPSNIIIRDDSSIKVMDFGIAKIVGSTKLTVTGQTMGTVRYMSPEQVRGKAVDHRSDLYSVGITLYQAVAGRTPFDGDSHFDIMRQHLTEVPPSPRDFAEMPVQLEEVLLRSLEKRVENRFQSAEEFLRALSRVPVDAATRQLTRSVPLPSFEDEKNEQDASSGTSSSASVEVPAATPNVDIELDRRKRPRRVNSNQAIIALSLVVVSLFLLLWVVFSGDEKPKRDPVGDVKKDVTVGKTKADARALKPKECTTSRKKWCPPRHVTTIKTFLVDKTFDKLIRVQAVGKRVSATQVKHHYRKAKRHYPRFLRSQKVSAKPADRPINVVVLSRKLFESQFGKGPSLDYHAPTATLHALQDKYFWRTLTEGFALHFCPIGDAFSNQRCQQLAGDFFRYLNKRNRRRR